MKNEACTVCDLRTLSLLLKILQSLIAVHSRLCQQINLFLFSHMTMWIVMDKTMKLIFAVSLFFFFFFRLDVPRPYDKWWYSQEPLNIFWASGTPLKDFLVVLIGVLARISPHFGINIHAVNFTISECTCSTGILFLPIFGSNILHRHVSKDLHIHHFKFATNIYSITYGKKICNTHLNL